MSLSLAESMFNAASLAIAGKKEDALAELRQARDAGHRSPKLSSAIGHLQFELRHFEPAAAAYEEALRLDRDDSTSHYNRGVCLEKLESWEPAAAAFQRAIDLDSRRASAYLGLGIAQLHRSRPQEALDAFEKCLERQPFREAALRGQAVALHLVGRFPEAAECYQKLLARDPRSEELLGNIISLAMPGRRLRVAVAVRRTPAGNSARRADRPGGGRPGGVCQTRFRLRPSVLRRPGGGRSRQLRGVVQLRRGAPEAGAVRKSRGCLCPRRRARSAVRRSAPQPGNRAPRNGALGCRAGGLRKGPDARPASPDRTLEPGLLWESRKELRQAESLYARLVEHYPDAQEAWFRLGYVRLLLGDLAASIKTLQACLALPKKCPEALLNIGIAYWKMRNIEMAKETFRQAIGAGGRSIEGLRCLAAIALQQQDYEQALTLHKQLLELDEPTSDLLYNLALVFQKRGRAADAVRYYRQALAVRADFPQALLNLGHALMTLGKHEEAQAAWQSALGGSAELAEQFLV